MLPYMIALLRLNQKGASAVEYGLVVALIAVAAVAAITALGGQLSILFNKVVTSLGG